MFCNVQDHFSPATTVRLNAMEFHEHIIAQAMQFPSEADGNLLCKVVVLDKELTRIQAAVIA